MGDASPAPVEVWRAVLDVHATIVAELDARLRAKHRLAVSEFDVLVNIGPREQVRHGELAGRVLLTRTALTRMIDRLVARELLHRGRAAGDLRGVVVSLTDAGRRVRRESARTNSATVRAAFSGLSPDQLRQLDDALATVRRSAGELTASKPTAAVTAASRSQLRHCS